VAKDWLRFFLDGGQALYPFVLPVQRGQAVLDGNMVSATIRLAKGPLGPHERR
jgi:hypothetical protein